VGSSGMRQAAMLRDGQVALSGGGMRQVSILRDGRVELLGGGQWYEVGGNVARRQVAAL
jgi:hypothetical protein